MTPTKWLRGYEREDKAFMEIFDSNGEPMFDDLELFDTYVEKFPIGMKVNLYFITSHIGRILRLPTY